MTDDRLIKSYVWHDDKCFFVSTITRDSSSIMGGRYAETIAWDFDWDNNKRGDIIGEASGYPDTISSHQNVCKMLFDTGKCEVDEADD